MATRTKRTDEEIADQLEHRDRSLDVWRSAAPLHRITDARNAVVAAEAALADAVRAARDDEYSWLVIGIALGGVSKQAAQQRFSR
jgi:hypothetical protein